MMPTSNEIDHFLELYKTLHLSNAALRLGITQPSLSQSLQKLEQKVGAPLFIRTRRGLVPTPSGKQFHANAKILVDGWAALSAGVAAVGEELTGRFRLGCHPSVAAYTVPILLRKLNAAAPLVELQLIHETSRRVTERLVSYEMDLAYVINPIRHPDLVVSKLGEDRVSFWRSRGKASIPKRVIMDSENSRTSRLFERVRERNFAGWSVTTSSSLELTRTLVLSGQGVGILPERVARVDASELAIYDSNLPVNTDEISLIYRKGVLTSKAGKSLLSAAKISLD